MAPWRLKTQRRFEDMELNLARSKPDIVRTTLTFVHHYNSTQTQRQFFFQYSPSSRPTSHLRYGQVEVRGDLLVMCNIMWMLLWTAKQHCTGGTSQNGTVPAIPHRTALYRYLKVLYKSTAACDWIWRTLIVAVCWTDPDVAIIAQDHSCSTWQVVEVCLATSDQWRRNVDENTLTQLHTTPDNHTQSK